MTEPFADEDAIPAGVPDRVVSSWRVAASVSLLLHAGLGAFALRTTSSGAVTDPRVAELGRIYPLPDPDAPFVVELPAMALPELSDAVDPVAPTPAPVTAGGATIARTDDEHAGVGGDPTVTAKARNLAPRPEERTTIDTFRDAIDDEQENRLLTAKKRASRVDLRLALEPMELTFVASGKGFRFERHPVASSDATLGAQGGKGMPSGGAALGKSAVAGEGPLPALVGVSTLGGAMPSPKGGASYGKTWIGEPREVGAAVTKARPHVDKGKPSVTADDKGTPADTVDSDQAVALALKSVVSNSTPGAASLGDGKGGSFGGGEAGAGGSGGSGSKTAALGSGSGDSDAPHAIERTEWYRALKNKLGPMLSGAFPHERELELRNGTVIVDLVIAKAGKVLEVIVVRPSGFDEFDQNVVTRLRGSSSLEPVPDLLSKGPTITVRVPVSGGWHLE